ISSPLMPKRWQKVLWKDQPDYADNHVDMSFLEGMEKNANFTEYSYRDLVLASGALVQHFSSIFIFCNVFIRIFYHRMDVDLRIVASVLVLGFLAWNRVRGLRSPLILACNLIVLSFHPCITTCSIRFPCPVWVGCIAIQITNRQTTGLANVIASASILSSLLLGISPILKTLTLDISQDSIWTMTALMLLCNVIFHNYDHDAPSGYIEFPDSLSINAVRGGALVSYQ
ncbi:MAG: hypothetical protein SGCHY_004329, partial [Lobulomycetales sp.]